ncbi:hypothetical protein LTR99_008386 [Exophiala xenobiotica]|uniref:Uncharacterized protein n=1 Tax=Vermiconidia calcicola TaxID=1690605 RepID=A0AAV9Q368_9PEZI|nr:hypothetical protein LTR72_008483 [Exophiala xenobiotica]KAK5531158.1 hypothetical protein LTR23_010072 [Chaetothyriales sp. CCFEE 6169]KAK5532776.1 hypothetical protein LTR25_007480 [Vermiconidia calcicola]KAK5290480.1 hypothetical protein LTR14_006783 [Exophiala xenobiotica]KAK5296745.1 hypothetical protein LTR99_008386 [Exophiala xenobiotica]
MAQPGYLRVQFTPAVPGPEFEEWRQSALEAPPTSTLQQIFSATDEPEEAKPYRYENVYNVSDTEQIDLGALLQKWDSPRAKLTLLLYKRLNFDSHPGTETPVAGNVVVANSLTPSPEADDLTDYHDWYEQEHVHILKEVQGWRTGSRYELIAAAGEQAEYAGPFMAVHHYDETNGLGGGKWKKSVMTDWLKRVDQKMLRPPHRRTFKVVSVTKL